MINIIYVYVSKIIYISKIIKDHMQLPAPLCPSSHHQLPQQREKPCVRSSPYNSSTLWEDYIAKFELVAKLNRWDK